ncbi:hypothetical protein [Streptomyces albipurpureus]|uniref:Uncharacterized protein n=1 Tax=Streptomyces albipurpureus TaxID=2897419 RepID=A0ABT0UU91_9ACTN|nr:hypothetical protein [Streptomyces sp. CWNU-1]MCM2391806.1 hypothetical protein [Streptomyces sp. CWNU-1]
MPPTDLWGVLLLRSQRTLPYALMRTAAVFALSAGVAAPALVNAPPAHAAAVTSLTLDDGRLLTGAPSTALWVKVSVLASTAAGAEVLAATDDLTWLDTASAPPAWTTTEPIRLPEGVALGDYPVRVEYRLPNGSVQRLLGGTFSYKLHTGVSRLEYDRESTDYDNRHVVLSGTATTYNPATGARTPAREGTKVKVSLRVWTRLDHRQVTATALTGPAGGFAMPIAPDGEIQNGYAHVVEPAADTDPVSGFAVPGLSAETTKYRITAQTDRRRVHQGVPFTVKGKVERLTGDGWKPFAGAPIVTTEQDPRQSSITHIAGLLGSGTAAADGTFSYQAKAYTAAAASTFVRPSGHLADLAFDRSQVFVPQPVAYKNVKIALSSYGEVSASGQLAQGWCENERVSLQYSVDGRTWWNMRTVNTTSNCAFSTAAPGYVSAYYRVHHAESDYYREQASTPVYQSRYPVRFAGPKLSPARPAKNSNLTASGTLQRQVKGVWQPYAGAKLMVLFKPKGDTQWYWVAKGKSGSGGKYSLKGKVHGDGHWAVITEETKGYFHGETKVTYIDAR